MDRKETEKAYLMVMAYKEFNDTIEILQRDIEYCVKMLKQEDNQFWRRTVVRALFAMIEGVAHSMRQIALRASQQPRVAFSQGELQVLSEQSFELDREGRIVEKQIRTSLTGSIRFAFRAFTRVHMAEYDLDVGRDDGWGAFLRGIGVRDRLMHPKAAQDLTVSGDEMISIDRTFGWFMKSLKEAQNLSFAALKEDVEKHRAPANEHSGAE